jgi:dolichyl-diphosphooligosaccharide---protein glycosyltransferase
MISEQSPLTKWKPAIRITILLLICSVASLVRIFSVIRYESIIHEFDPWFNYRATKYLVNTDFKEFWNFFDS